MSRTRRNPSRRQRGMTMVELMISLLLGLLVVGAAIGLFVSNKRAYAATESIGRVQENARVAFELMAREIREAAGNPCSRDIPIKNVLNTSTDWWAQWGSGIRGYGPSAAFGTGGAPTNWVTTSDAIELRGAFQSGVSVEQHNGNSAQFKVSTVNHGFNDGDIAMVCDFDHAAIFQITNANSGTNDTVVHNQGTGTPGNSTKCLNTVTPSPCNNTNAYSYGKNSVLVKLGASRWYIATNGRGGRSLYNVHNDDASPTEVVDGIGDQSPAPNGVDGMRLTYLLDSGTSYVAASSTLDWSKVVAVKIELSLLDKTRVGTNGEGVARTLSHIVTLRNRVD